MIVPSIDLMGGRAVQLRRGTETVLVSDEDPVALARRFAFHGDVAVVDLDAALGRGSNRDLVRALCRVAPCRVGGGVRTVDDVVDLIKAGAARVIVGTAATPEFLGQFPREWLIVALDTRDGRVVDRGWTADTGETPVARARRLERYCAGFLYTHVETEGMLAGVPLEPVRALREATALPLTVAGGVRDADDVRALHALGADAQIGMALYTGRLDLDDALVACLSFDADGKRGLLPTIVQSARDGRVLMLAWSSEASLREALASRRGVYWSRSRQTMWRKGETSGHVQELQAVRVDCDGDALLFRVDQVGPACHTGRASCFGDGAPFDLRALRAVVAARGSADPAASYTARLLAGRDLVRAKIREEAGEVCDATERQNLVWELADLLYHTTALMEADGIALEEVEAELRGRHR